MTAALYAALHTYEKKIYAMAPARSGRPGPLRRSGPADWFRCSKAGDGFALPWEETEGYVVTAAKNCRPGHAPGERATTAFPRTGPAHREEQTRRDTITWFPDRALPENYRPDSGAEMRGGAESNREIAGGCKSTNHGGQPGDAGPAMLREQLEKEGYLYDAFDSDLRGADGTPPWPQYERLLKTANSARWSFSPSYLREPDEACWRTPGAG